MKKMLRRGLAMTLMGAMLASPAYALTAQQALELLDSYYLDEIPATSWELTTVEEVVASLGDPYTVYMPPANYEDFLEGVDGEQLVGIGVQIQQVTDKGIEIVAVLPDSSALTAGLVAGDCIIKVGGVEPKSMDHARELIVGEKGTRVSIVVRHADGSKEGYSLLRTPVTIPIVTYDTVGDVPFIDCSSFGSTTVSTIREAMTEYQDWKGSVVVNLQNNPGGTDAAAAGSAGVFLGAKTICYYMNGDGQVSSVATIQGTPDYTDTPIIVLTSGHSASGSEMFLGAIRSYDGGIAIGSRTYGKGVAQVALDENTHPELFDGDSLKITRSRFYAPDGATNDTVGVIPTLTIPGEYVEDVAVLLATPAPESVEGYLKLNLGGSTFYVDCEQATSEEYIPAFQQLLAAIAPTQTVSVGYEGDWVSIGEEATADYLGVDYESRYFTQLENQRYRDELNSLAVHYILPTDRDCTSNAPITRGDFAYLMAYALQLRIVEGNPFADVAEEDDNKTAIAALYAKRMISGDGQGNFRPDDLITGEEAVTLLYNVAQWVNQDAKMVAGAGAVTPELRAEYSDYADWAQEPAAILDYIDGLMKGIDPSDTVAHDQASAMIYTLFEGSGLLWN